MLDVPYASNVPQALIDVFEHHARRLGVPLDAVERMGGSLDLVESFIVAAEDGHGLTFSENLPAPTAPGAHATAATATPDAAELCG